MYETLRPLTLGEILDRTAQLYRSRFLVFFGIAAVPTTVVLIFASGIFLLFAWAGSNGTAPAPASNGVAVFLAVVFLVGVGLIVLAAFLAVTALAAAAISHAVARIYLGETTTIRSAYKAVWLRGWRYIWLYLLRTFIVWVAPFAAWFVVFIASAGTAALARSAGGVAAGALLGLIAFLAVVVLVAYAIWMALRLSLAFPSCVVEQTSAWPALKRSASLSKGTRGRIFVLYLLVAALNYLLSLVITIPMLIVIPLIPSANNPQHAQTVGMVVISAAYGAAFAVQALTQPVCGVALTLFYYDQRIRQEGFDIEWMMQRAGLVVPPPAQPPQSGLKPSEEFAQSSEPQPLTFEGPT